jgi:uncharacterized LabA/DUF88 family protein
LSKLAVFADIQNLYYTSRDVFDRSVNYEAIWDHLSTQGEIVQATAYAIEKNDPGQLRFQNALRQIGFTVKLKPFITRQDGSAKGDWDVGITIDMMQAAATADTVVLLSGDGDFAMLLNHLREQLATKSTVYGVSKLTAQALVNSADTFFAINESFLMNTR